MVCLMKSGIGIPKLSKSHPFRPFHTSQSLVLDATLLSGPSMMDGSQATHPSPIIKPEVNVVPIPRHPSGVLSKQVPPPILSLLGENH